MFYKPQYNTETQTSDNNTENDCDLRHRQKDAQMHSKGRHRILPTRSKGRPIYIGTQAKDLAPGVIFCNAQARARSQKGRDISRSEESKLKDATMTHCLVWSWLTDSALWWASMFNTPRCWTSTPLGSPPLVAKGSCAPWCLVLLPPSLRRGWPSLRRGSASLWPLRHSGAEKNSHPECLSHARIHRPVLAFALAFALVYVLHGNTLAQGSGRVQFADILLNVLSIRES